MNKQRVAREWLIALGAITVGLTVWPLAFHVPQRPVLVRGGAWVGVAVCPSL